VQLQNASAKTLDLDGSTFDEARKHVFNRAAYDGIVPRRVSNVTDREGRTKNMAALSELRTACRALGGEDGLP
jgi:hypothetical protein